MELYNFRKYHSFFCLHICHFLFYVLIPHIYIVTDRNENMCFKTIYLNILKKYENPIYYAFYLFSYEKDSNFFHDSVEYHWVYLDNAF